MRIFELLARSVAAETAALLAPAMDRMEAHAAETRTLLDGLQARLDRLLLTVERIEAERPGWLASQTLSSLERDMATFVRPNGTTHTNGIERETR